MTTEKIAFTLQRAPDYRIESLKKIINALDDVINSLKKRRKEEDYWYDGLMLLEDIEPILGLAFVSFQNYINGSIKDFSIDPHKKNEKDEKYEYYKIAPALKGYEKSSIELIIGLANYSKHKDDHEQLRSQTKSILESFRLSTKQDLELDIDKSPIFEGLTILSDGWNLSDVLQIVTTWREKLWTNNKSQNQ